MRQRGTENNRNPLSFEENNNRPQNYRIISNRNYDNFDPRDGGYLRQERFDNQPEE